MVHVILSVFFISIGTDLKQQDPAWVIPDLEAEEVWDDEGEWDDEPTWDEYDETVVQGY